jgi:triosephosphate isomerase
MRQLIAGNWKMNGLTASLEVVRAAKAALAADRPGTDVLICPPATLIAKAVAAADGILQIGAQDCHAEPTGPYTGDVSAEMLADAGAVAVILGHSERRQMHGETGVQVAAKTRAAWRAGLLAIVCVGEAENDRRAGSALDVCRGQLADSVPIGATATNTVVAYEPIWAIGTGHVPSAEEIAEMHAHIRNCLMESLGQSGRDIRILYGGSVKPENAREILGLPEVGGALVGGASLKAQDFLSIVRAATTP